MFQSYPIAMSNPLQTPVCESIFEPTRSTPVVGRFDVVVAGGGPAGVAAAVTAARSGASVLLIELQGALGGVWTAGLLSHIIDWHNKPGLMIEIMNRLDAMSGKAPDDHSYEAEVMKRVLDDMTDEAGVRVRLHSRIVAAQVQPDRRLTHVITESKSGRQAWAGRIFIDCTGDGDLAAQAGCGFDIGHPQTGQCQPLSLMAVLCGASDPDLEPFIIGQEYGFDEPKNRLLERLAAVGLQPSYSRPTLFRIQRGLLAMMANHEYGIRCDDAQAITAATMRARREVHRVVETLCRTGRPFASLRIVATSAHIGVREGRRIHGRYTLTADDLRCGARFDDAVCRVTFPVDVHATSPKHGEGGGYDNSGVKAQPYDVPLRSLLAADIDNLLMAGRCISGDFIAHASYRVTGNAVAMGQAAGHHAAHQATQAS